MPEEDLSTIADEELREQYKKSYKSSSDTVRFRLAEEIENRGLIVPIPEDEESAVGAAVKTDKADNADGENSTDKLKSIKTSQKTPEDSKTSGSDSAKPKTEDKKSKSKGKSKSKEEPDKKVEYAIIGMDRQQIIHNILERTCKTIGLRYVKASEINAARKTLSSGAAVAAIFEYDQSEPKPSLDYCKLANLHSVPPVLMGRFFKTDVLQAMRAGVADIIKKPMDQEFLKLKIQKLLQKTGKSGMMGGESAVEKIDFGGRTTPDEKAALLVQKAKELLALPNAVTEAIRICNNPNSDMKELQLPVSSDPALSSLILRRSNSAASAASRRITHILDAVVRIGRKEVKTLALTLSVFNMFSRQEQTFGFNRQMYWVHALATGITAKAIAESVKDINPEDAFLGGLLHDLGKIIFDDYMNKEYQQVIGQAGGKNLRIGQVELEIFAMDHAMLGARVAENWKLPDTVSQSIRMHHKVDTLFNPDAWGEDGRPIIPQIVCMANSVVKAMRLGHSGDFFADDIPLSAWTDIFPKSLPAAKIVGTVLKELDEFAQFLKINLRAAFVDVNVERKEGLALVTKEGLGPLFRFFFESYGYASQFVPMEKFAPAEGIAYLGMDARDIGKDALTPMIERMKDQHTKMILMRDSAPENLPINIKCPQPIRDFLQMQCALES